MLTKYGPNNQHLIETKSQLDTVNAQIAEEVARINERAHQEYLFAVRKEDGLRKAVDRARNEASALNSGAVKLQALSQEAASSRQLYDSLYGKLKELNDSNRLFAQPTSESPIRRFRRLTHNGRIHRCISRSD